MVEISRTEKDQPYKGEKNILSPLQWENNEKTTSITTGLTADKKLNDHLSYSFIRLFGFWTPPVP